MMWKSIQAMIERTSEVPDLLETVEKKRDIERYTRAISSAGTTRRSSFATSVVVRFTPLSRMVEGMIKE